MKPSQKPLTFPEDEGNFFLVSLSPKIISSKEVSIKGYLREFMDRSNNPGQVSFSPRHISTLPNLGEIDTVSYTHLRAHET